MLQITMSTPALVFPALSVLMLAYTNRFIAISKRVRALHTEHKANPKDNLKAQIIALKKRLILIRNTQTLAILGFILNMASMFLLLIGINNSTPSILFAIGMIFVIGSLIICLQEIYISVQAMSIQLKDDEDDY